jgi:S-DNA-T family DNA segregation ATPase FtsK/SpoIIIE
MKNSYIPEIFKVKIAKSIRFLHSLIYLLICIFFCFSLISFNFNDNSFISNTSLPTENYLGNLGAYTSSFVFYTFGYMGYGIVLFFLILSFLGFYKKHVKFFFIRLLGLIVSLILIPQILIHFNIKISFYSELPVWGSFAIILNSYFHAEFFNYLLTIFGSILFIVSTNLFVIFKLPKINFSKLKIVEKKIYSKPIKKEPVIKQMNISNSKLSGKETDSSKAEGYKNYSSPSLDILENGNIQKKKLKNSSNIEESSELLEKVFADFNITINVINVKLGPVITLYEILPAAGIKINTIINLADDISRSMGVGAVRIAQIYGTQYLGVEIPNDFRETVTIKELLSDSNFKNTSHKIPICIGKDISGKIEVIDLSKTPHLLVAGTTGSGKSVFINTLLTSLLYKFSPEDLKLILIDPKMLELSVYNDIAHLLTPVVTEPKKAIVALKWVCKEMERRYSLMNEENTRSLEGFNEKSQEKLPFIVVFIDEMADLMMTAGKEVEHYVQRLAQMARACGIHLVMATQRPSVDIITGSIKANFPSRISFQVASKYDSRTVLGEIGAEQLLGNGDMLMSKNGGNLIRYQSAFISDNEVNKLIKEIKQSQTVNYLDELEEIIKNDNENFDSLSDEDEDLISRSIDLIKSTNKASTSFLQRNFQIGYNKAARIMEALEQRGVVSAPNHTGKREILINNN